MTIVKKSSFTAGEDGRLFRTASLKPRIESGGTEGVFEKGTLEVAGSNDAVGTVEEDATDETKIKIFWVGPGDLQVQAKGDSDPDAGEQREISGVLDLKFEEDEANTIDIVLDEVPA